MPDFLVLYRLLKRLTQSLQTSGVDVSHANISVQLDVGKQVHSGSNAIAPSVGVCSQVLFVYHYCLKFEADLFPLILC